MNDTERMGLVALMVRELNEASSWTARIHIQKLTYLAQELLGLNTDYEFVLYQRGPYSFDLDGDIRSLRSIGGAEIVLRPAPYGPSYVTTSVGDALVSRAPVDQDLAPRVRQLAKKIGSRAGRELELLATTLYVEEEGPASDDDVVERVRRLKPHFDETEVRSALREVRELRSAFAG